VLAVERRIPAGAIGIADELPASQSDEFLDPGTRAVQGFDYGVIARLRLDGGEQSKELDLFEPSLGAAVRRPRR